MADGNPAKRVRRAPAAVSIDFTSEKLPFVTLTNGAGDTVKVYPYGACVTSYVKGGKEVFAMRADNKMDGTKPISGGIPILEPQNKRRGMCPPFKMPGRALVSLLRRNDPAPNWGR